MKRGMKLLNFIALSLTSLILIVTATPHEVTKLADGLLIQKGDDLRSHIASWTVLIVLHPPPPPNQLDETIDQIRKVIEERGVHSIRQDLRDNWERRLKWIDHHPETASSLDQKNATATRKRSPDQETSSITRKRRGILNCVG